jgi:hypothetical protein
VRVWQSFCIETNSQVHDGLKAACSAETEQPGSSAGGSPIGIIVALSRRGLDEFAMTEFGKLLIFLGVILVAVGAVVLLLGRTGLPIGRLPGDLVLRGKNTKVYFPIVTCVVVSVVLTVVMWVVQHFRR